MNDYLVSFRDVWKQDSPLVGGKGASLGELTHAGISIPQGFILTTKAYNDFSQKDIPQRLQAEIMQAFTDLKIERVAVRSSAIAEDSLTASWAGQLESYLNVTKEDLINAIKKCWRSITSDRAKAYAKEQKLTPDKIAVAVVIQKMVNSEVAGVMFTANPISNNNDEIMIEAGYGLGELLVQGMITPDNYIVDKQSLESKNKSLGSQQKMLVYKHNKNVEVPVPENLQNRIVLSEKQIKELAKLGKSIEAHYNFPQDIEWAFEKEALFIVQSRPITT